MFFILVRNFLPLIDFENRRERNNQPENITFLIYSNLSL